MISEQELAKLSYPNAPNIVTEKIPGPKTKKLFEDSYGYESFESRKWKCCVLRRKRIVYRIASLSYQIRSP